MVVARDTRARAVFDAAERLAREALPAVVAGEPGSGRQTVAMHLHRAGGVLPEQFQPVDCELMGDLRFVATARPGALFLRNVDRLRRDLQARLAEWIDVRNEAIRVVASASPDLARQSEIGRFCPDLYEKLGGVGLHIPPLRSRPSDVPDLCLWFLERAGRDAGDAAQFLDACLAYLIRYDWPGNVTELRQVMERVARRSGRSLLSAEHLPPQIRWFPGCTGPKVPDSAAAGGFNPLAEDFQIRLIADALRRTHHP